VIDHLTLRVRNLDDQRAFFEKALAPLGYERLMDFGDDATGFGVPPKPDFWIARYADTTPGHVAFRCDDHESVEAFHAAALAAGGKDNGAPGPRPHYHKDYYGAFVLDPEGNNIEAVCHAPAGSKSARRRPTKRRTATRKATRGKASKAAASLRKRR
jgi:catechol 2,3-dioxygenase-like lactoylglutathione lyase family enzyme